MATDIPVMRSAPPPAPKTAEPATPRRRDRMTWPQRLLFTAFVLTATVIFGAVTLMPVVRDYAELLEEKRVLRLVVERRETRINDMQRFADSIRNDPRVVEQLALTDLGYARPGETIVRIDEPLFLPTAATEISTGRRRSPVIPHTWPLWAHRAEHWAARRGLTAMALDKQRRAPLLLSAAGLVIAAFVLFTPRNKRAPFLGMGD